jgi:predicted nucleic acid-binding protein
VAERHYWDTSVWIDLLNEQGGLAGPASTLWGAVQRGALEVAFSAITIAETLVKPAGKNPLRPWADPHHTDPIFETEGLLLVQVDRVIGERTRSLRRAHALKTPDAIHLACAIEHNADMFVTGNSDDFGKLPQQYRKDGKPLVIGSPSDALLGPLFKPATGGP